MGVPAGLRLLWLCIGLGSGPCLAALTYPNCADLQAGDFKSVPVVGKFNHPLIQEPLKMAFDADAAGKADIYFVERLGTVQRYSAQSGMVSLLGTIRVDHVSEDGLTGIALDPGFKSNRWIYLYYSLGPEFRLSRFTLKGEALDPGSETIMIHIPSRRDGAHTAGAMAFDAYGDLWLAVGDNRSSAQMGPSNTDNLRGKILRIHPQPDGKYTIPDGNLRSTIRNMPNTANADTAKVRPEIYVMGCRNPYTIALDPVRRWLAWGDVGPDFGGVTEEHNLVKRPGFMGYPYFAGGNIVTLLNGSPQFPGQNPLTPRNTDGDTMTGLRDLPPAIPAIHAYNRASAMTGPIYRYDGDSKSPIKFPPHFHRKWIVGDFRDWIHVLTLDDAGEKVLAEDTPFASFTFHRPLDIQMGPDGALYVLNYDGWASTGSNTGIVRIEYRGTCRPAEPKLETINPTAALASAPLDVPWCKLEGRMVSLSLPALRFFELVSLAGKRILTRAGSPLKADPETQRFLLPGSLPAGVYILHAETSSGTLVKKLLLK